MFRFHRRPEGGQRLLEDLWQVVAAHRWRVLGAVVFLILAKVASVAVPLVLKRIIDALSRPEQVLLLPVLLLAGYAALRFSSTLFNELRDLLFSRVTQRTVAAYAMKVFTHLHRLGSRFHAQHSIGGLLPDIDRGTAGIAFLLGVGLFTLVPTLVEIGLVLAILVSRYSIWYTTVISATFLLYTGFTILFTARRALFQRRVNRLDSNAKSRLADSLINYDAVKYFTNEDLEAQRFREIMEDWTAAAIQNQKALFTLHVGQSAIIGVGVAAIMLLAGHDVMTRRLTVGDLVLINAYMLQICLPLNSLGFVYREARDALVNTEKLFQLLRERPETEEPAGLPALDVATPALAFEHVSFQYDPARPILRDVSFRVPPGRTVAVVGGSGSGKSTLARLLLRFYEASEGRITVDGRDIREVASHSLRQSIGVVPQDTILFNDTIAYNIGYGRPGATPEAIIAAAKAAHVHDFIESLPLKYDTPAGERGVQLSGGERQRIAIARAILKDPPILIFDEATSALDSQSERAIQDELDRLSHNRTALVIAHRLSTVVDADEILVLEHGRIVERGTHADLLRLGGVYAQLWRLQLRAEKLQESGVAI
ncbi:MAG: ABC transporter ATP-binding protein/permease [Pseudomonadota bacterium]